MSTNHQFLLCRRPQGDPVPSDFTLVETAILPPEAGTFIGGNHFVSLDPAQRGYMDDVSSNMVPKRLGGAVTATTVGRVHASANRVIEKAYAAFTKLFSVANPGKLILRLA